MMTIPRLLALSSVVFTLALTGCAGTQPLRYADLPSSPQLQPNGSDNTPYMFSTHTDWRDYSAIIIDPVNIYAGADNQFGDLSEADKRELVQEMNKEFGKSVSAKFRLTNQVRPGTLRLKLTLTGAKNNTAVVSTFTRFDLVGLPYNAVQGIRGKEGMFMGSVSYSVEVFDASSNRLLKAYVTKQFPNAMNVSATVGSLSAAKTGIEKGAQELLTQLQ